MSDTYAIVLEDSPTSDDISVVRRGLGQFNRETAGFTNDSRSLALFIRDATGQTVGGLTGFTLGTWFHIEFLWLDERIRRKGYGGRLLHRAEEEARARGCLVAELRTFNFQAPQFYEKQGYVRFAELSKVGTEHATLHFYRKYFGSESGGTGL